MKILILKNDNVITDIQLIRDDEVYMQGGEWHSGFVLPENFPEENTKLADFLRSEGLSYDYLAEYLVFHMSEGDISGKYLDDDDVETLWDWHLLDNDSALVEE